MSFYWLQQTLAVLPLVLWVYFVIGIPYALLALPRQDWSRKIDVLALAFAFGPGLLTLWMLILGTIGGAEEIALLRFDFVFAGTVMIALIGIFFAWRKYHQGESDKMDNVALAFDEKLLISLIVIAFVVRWIVTSYWSFTAYDALWVYGFEGRLYQMFGYIPQDIGYYPQFIPLQFTFMQLLSDGFDDHAARAIIPFMQLGSIFAAYVMGSRLFTRRTGIIAAAIWTLYPHMAQWAHVGDLEIPLTFSLTLTMTFFLLAWFQGEKALRRRYALIAGLCFGIAMWTKPTGGAFIWGVVLLVVVEFIRVRFNFRQFLPRFEIAFITGLASIPLGAIWYLRNIALGLPALVFPHPSWLTRATRSGDLLSFPILALLLAIAYLVSTRKLKRGWFILAGVILMLSGAMQSSPLFNELRRNPPESYITLLEATAIISGLTLIAWGLKDRITDKSNTKLHKIGWAYLLILPYFMTWFWSYSYHARLSFPIVPILLLPIALIMAQWHSSEWKFILRITGAIIIILLSIPGIITPIIGIDAHYDWLWINRYPDDFSRTRIQNPGVALVAEQLWGYEAYHGIQPVVIAPGEQRLRFFMPDVRIITDTIPRGYEEIEDATHLIYGSQARWRYQNDAGILPLDNRIVASLGREDLFNKVLDFEDGTFEYELYELNLNERYEMPERGPSGHQIEEEVIFGESIRYIGDSISNTQMAGNRIAFAYLWEVIAPPQGNYLVRVELLNIDDNEIYRTWQTTIAPTENAYYNTELWEVDELIVDNHSIMLDYSDMPRGTNIYRFVVNFVDAETGETIPMTIDGEAAEGYIMSSPLSIGQ